jgi:hypothetical protein
MSEYEVTKSEVIEIMTRIPAEIKLFKNLKTGKIVGELMVDYTFFGDFNLERADLDCRPDDPTWKKFFAEQFNDFDYSTVIRRGH